MATERRVAAYYARPALQDAIFRALRQEGKDPDRLAPGDLAGVDEFHLGWRMQTEEFARLLGLAPGMRVLDIGCGLGGPARHYAWAHGCSVAGIDLTLDYLRVARELTRRSSLADQVTFTHGSALALPFERGSFEAATLIHVGMNIADKAALFAEVRRVLAPGGRFGVYDVLSLGEGTFAYPMPWAESAETSFVASAALYRRLLLEAGFTVEHERDRCGLALDVARRARERSAAHGRPPLGLHVLMGDSTPERLGNLMAAVERGTLAPVEFVARAR